MRFVRELRARVCDGDRDRGGGPWMAPRVYVSCVVHAARLVVEPRRLRTVGTAHVGGRGTMRIARRERLTCNVTFFFDRN